MAHILLVEDDIFFIELLRAMLQRDGHQVATAGDGVAALRWLEAHQPDLIITDVVMPDMDGMELIHALKAQHSHVPVIVMSGGQRSCLKELSQKSIQQLGFTTSLMKPFTRVALRQAVELALVEQVCPTIRGLSIESDCS